MGSSQKDRGKDVRDPGREVLPEDGADQDDLCIEDVMSSNVISVNRSTAVGLAARLMRDRDIGFLPVVNDDGGVVGVLTDRDLVLGVLANNKPSTTRVDEVMTPDPVTVNSHDDLDECERLMRDHRINRMVVLDDGARLVGVVSLADLAGTESDSEVGEVVAEVKQDGAF